MSEERRKRIERARARVERELESRESVRLLKERIAYHQAKLEDERLAREGS